MTRSRAATHRMFCRQDAIAEFFCGGVGFSPQRRLQPASDLPPGAIMSIAIPRALDATC